MQNEIISILESGGTIILAALVLGFIMKKWMPGDNKYIPTLNFLIGGVLGIITHCFPDVGPVTQFIQGAVCGVAASFLYDKIGAQLADLAVGMFNKSGGNE